MPTWLAFGVGSNKERKLDSNALIFWGMDKIMWVELLISIAHFDSSCPPFFQKWRGSLSIEKTSLCYPEDLNRAKHVKKSFSST